MLISCVLKEEWYSLEPRASIDHKKTPFNRPSASCCCFQKQRLSWKQDVPTSIKGAGSRETGKTMEEPRARSPCFEVMFFWFDLENTKLCDLSLTYKENLKKNHYWLPQRCWQYLLVFLEMHIFPVPGPSPCLISLIKEEEIDSSREKVGKLLYLASSFSVQFKKNRIYLDQMKKYLTALEFWWEKKPFKCYMVSKRDKSKLMARLHYRKSERENCFFFLPLVSL